jgi:hypothetical protein
MWGWSHVPFFGGVFEGNVIEDSAEAGVLGVEHGPYSKSNKGRTYMTISLRNNTVRWTDSYLKRARKEGPNAGPKGLTIGYPGSIDPAELVVSEKGDRLQVSSGTRPSEVIHVNSALLNGQRTVKRRFVLPVVPSSPEVSRAVSP